MQVPNAVLGGGRRGHPGGRGADGEPAGDPHQPEGDAADLGIGPGFDELLELTRRYLDGRVRPLTVDGAKADPRDVGIYHWRRQAIDVLETALRGAGPAGVTTVPILGSPEWLDSARLRRFQWTGLVARGRRCHTNKVPCHTDLEKQFAEPVHPAEKI